MAEESDIFIRTEGHEVKEVPDGYVVYQTERERVHFLNPTAVIVYELCDGAHNVERISSFIAGAYELAAPPVEEVSACIASLLQEELVRPLTPSLSAA
jgi:hypothetical protein